MNDLENLKAIIRVKSQIIAYLVITCLFTLFAFAASMFMFLKAAYYAKEYAEFKCAALQCPELTIKEIIKR